MGRTRVWRQDAINAVSDRPDLAAEVDRRWVDDPTQTFGERMNRLTDLCMQVLEEDAATRDEDD